MPSGGHPRSGPAPDPTSFRSAAIGASGGWTTMALPPETPPAWPLGVPTDAESALWADVWTRPAASLWQTFGLVRDVATYVRTVLAFETGGHSNAALGGLVQRMADQLGLTVAGAARNRWSWPAPPRTGARSGSGSGTGTFRPGVGFTSAADSGRRPPRARDRFRVISPGDRQADNPTDETSA
jgi:hypothetical protein